MKSIVLDANELARDLLCESLPFQLLEHMLHATWVHVYVPAVAFEETIAIYQRDSERMQRTIEQLARQRRRLGLLPVDIPNAEFDYREYLIERFDSQLAISVLPWPDTPHKDLVMRAVSRKPPFNEKGSGYRDSLIWADVVKLAQAGQDVAFVSADRIFAGEDGKLPAVLQAEIDPLPGSVELVRDFRSWLLSELPWKAEDLGSAVAESRNQEFYAYLLQSDLQLDLVPAVEDLGFQSAPYSCELLEIDWEGNLSMIGASDGPEGMTLVEYDLDFLIEFEAEFPMDFEPQPGPGWIFELNDVFRRVSVTGQIQMVVRIAVLFGGELGFTVEQISWRRADGVGPGSAAYSPDLDPRQPSLFDALASEEKW